MIIPIVKYMNRSTPKTEQDRYIIFIYLIQIVDLKNHHSMNHPLKVLGTLPIIKISFKLNNYIEPIEFRFT